MGHYFRQFRGPGRTAPETSLKPRTSLQPPSPRKASLASMHPWPRSSGTPWHLGPDPTPGDRNLSGLLVCSAAVAGRTLRSSLRSFFGPWCVCVCIYIYIYICVCVCVWVCVSLCVCVCVCCVCVCVCLLCECVCVCCWCCDCAVHDRGCLLVAPDERPAASLNRYFGTPGCTRPG